MIYRNHPTPRKLFPLCPERACLLLLATFCLAAPVWAQAQTDEMPPPPIMAPAKTIPAADRTLLDGVVKPKDRAKKGLDLAEGYLKRAEQFTEKQEFEAALSQLGIYQGIVADTLKFLKPFREQRLREPFRNVEVALRGYAPRLEGIRRQTPMEYGVHVRTIGDYTRDARTEALNAFFDDTVIAEPPKSAPATDATQTVTARGTMP